MGYLGTYTKEIIKKLASMKTEMLTHLEIAGARELRLEVNTAVVEQHMS
jgi:hypothetical protein